MLLFFLYLGFAHIGTAFSLLGDAVSPIWPAAGLAIFALYRWGLRLWPVVALSAFVSSWINSNLSVWVSLILAASSALEAVVGAWLLRRWIHSSAGFKYLVEPIAVVSACAAGATVSAAMGATALLQARVVSAEDFGSTIFTWWLGNLIGGLVLVPSLLAAAEPRTGRLGFLKDWPKRSNLILFGLLGIVAYLIVFQLAHLAHLMAVFPILLIVASFRGKLVLQLVSVLLCTVSIVSIYAGNPPFQATTPENLLNMQVFVLAMAISALMLGEFREVVQMRQPARILLGGWLICTLVVIAVQHSEARRDWDRFQDVLADAQRVIHFRTAAHEDVLRAAASLFVASGEASEEEWHSFVKSLDLVTRYAGMHGMSVAERVHHKDLKDFLARMRTIVAPDFKVYRARGVSQPRAPPEDYFIVKFVESLTKDFQVRGLDLGSDPRRRWAAEKARDSGNITLSERVDLHLKDPTPGFLLFLPVYRPGLPVSTVEERRRALWNWIVAPLVTQDFFASILAGALRGVEVAVFDSPELGPESLLYTSVERPSGTYQVVTPIEIGQRPMYLAWRRAPDFPSSRDKLGALVALVGTLMTLLVTAVVVNVQITRDRAHEIASQLTEEFRRSEERFRTLAGSAPIGICQFDPLGFCTYTNSAWQKISGQSLAASLGIGWLKVFTTRDRRTVRDLWRKYRRTEVPQQSLVLQVLLPEPPHRRWVRARLIDMRSRQGKRLGLVATIEDITSERMREAVLTLENAVDRYLLDPPQGHEFYTGLIRVITLTMNWGGGSYWESPDDAPGPELRVYWGDGGHRDRFYQVEEFTRSLLGGTGRAAYLPDKQERRFLLGFVVWTDDRVDGVFMFNTGASPESDPNLISVLEGIGLRIGHVVERRRSEALLKLKEAKMVAASKMASLGEMAGGIAHEINNPLAIIESSAYLISASLPEEAPFRMAHENSNRISQTVERIARIVRGLQTFARSGERDPLADVPIGDVVANTLELCRERFHNNHVQLRVKGPLTPHLYCREVQVSQVLLNLLNNAIDAVVGRPDAWTEIEIVDAGPQVELRVRDSGYGIPPDVARRIMEPFFTTKEIGKGTGLGLSISKGIVEDHGGVLYLDVTEKHTCFVVRLPHRAQKTDQVLA